MAMIFTLEALQGQEGDCLLLHWGTKEKPRLAVIDGGPGRVFENALEPRLEEIRENRELDQLPIDIVMVSHVDNDHIVGIKKLFRKLKAEIDKNTPEEERPFKVARLWFNTFNDILGDGIDKYYKKFTASFTASVNGEPDQKVVDELKKELEKKGAKDAAHTAYDIGLILAGHGEARELRDNHKFLFDHQDIAELNHPFKKGGKATLITSEMTPEPVSLNGLKFTVAGPLEAQIKALQKAFDEFIEERGLTAEAVLAAYSDPSIPNLSSIVCLVEFEGKTILLTGDARGDFTLDGLRKAKILKDATMKVDILKVPHHGSDKNVEEDYFKTIIADTYVFSADGKHGNPDRETLEMLIDARGKAAKYNLVLTYPVKEIDKVRKAKSKKPWKPAEHALATLFKQRKDAGFKFNVIDDEGGRVELGEEIPW
jgi:hypothetical protein